MSARLAALAVALLGLLAWLARPAPGPPLEAVGPGPRGPAKSGPDGPAAAAPALSRDPFRYGDQPSPRAVAPPAAPVVVREPPPAPVPTPEPVRLSGFVRRGRELKAVLWVSGTTVVVAAGESAEGYRVLSVDEDSGVRLRGASGEELVLRTAPR